MKVLTFGVLYFKLPDDFDGGLSDALRAFADYHDKVTDLPGQEIGEPQDPPADLTAPEHEQKVWERFWDMIHNEDRRVTGSAGLAEYFTDERPGIHLDLNTGVPDGKQSTTGD